MTRAFVAVQPPDTVLDAVAARVARVAPLAPEGARITSREQWHLTLQFLGNRADLDAVAAALRDIAVQPGAVQLGGGGAFPNPRRARVLWLGLHEGDTLLQEVAVAVGACVAPLGHEPEVRSFHPHLTLARCKVPTDLRASVDALGDEAVGAPWCVDEIVVFESRLRSTGAQYVPRASIPLVR